MAVGDDKRYLPLQDSVLALLCLDNKHGSAIAAQVRPEYFDGVYRDLVTRVLKYRHRWGKAPGRRHISDIANRSFLGKENVLVKKRLLPAILAAHGELNAEYIVSRTQDFVKRQILRRTLLEASDRYEQDDEEMPVDVEKILYDGLRFRAQTLDVGTRLSDPKGLDFLDAPDEHRISLGIPQLDRMGIGMWPKQMLLYIAPKGSGKTWFCIHCARQAVMQGKKVLHVTLEMSEREIMERYYQAVFAVARRSEKIKRTRLVLDELGRFSRFKTRRYEPRYAFDQPKIKRILKKKMRSFGTRFDKLIIKEFPSGTLTLNQLVGYMDFLADVHDFIPDVLIIDYADLMAVDTKNFRIDTGRNFVNLRGLAQQRNVALVTPTQGGRKTIRAKRVRSTGAAEDISKVLTADTTLAFSRTEAEEERNLGRLSVEHTRKSGNALLLLTQSYATGQFILDSVHMQTAYTDQMKKLDPERSEEPRE